MAAAARFSRGRASAEQALSSLHRRQSSTCGARSPLVSTKYQHGPFKMQKRNRYSLHLPRPPIGPAARATKSRLWRQKPKGPGRIWTEGHGPKVTMHHRVTASLHPAWVKMSCQRAVMHTVAFCAPLRPQPPNYIRISTATAVQPAFSPTSLATTPQKSTPFLVPAFGCLEAERK